MMKIFHQARILSQANMVLNSIGEVSNGQKRHKLFKTHKFFLEKFNLEILNKDT